jgi:superfamily II DNA/RNA helicase
MATCASVNFHHPALVEIFKSSSKANVQVFKLHGKIDQKKRTKIYKQFKEAQMTETDGKKNHLILLTTDLSARGIDIPDVDWIV